MTPSSDSGLPAEPGVRRSWRSRLRKYFGRGRRFLMKGYRLPVCLSLLATVFVLWLHGTDQPMVSSLLERLDHLVYDHRYNRMLEAPAPAPHKIVIVDYDQKSLEAEGQWPWSRFKIGDLVQGLREAGALVIGFDVSFPERERNLAAELRLRLRQQSEGAQDKLGHLLPQLAELEQVLNADAYFAQQMEASDVVLGYSFRPQEALQTGSLPEPVIRLSPEQTDLPTLAMMQGYVGNVKILQDSAAGAGFFVTQPDLDGVIRRVPLVLRYQNALYPSLPLVMAQLYFFEDNFSLATEADQLNRFRSITGINMGSVHIPTDASARVLVPYTGPAGAYPYISATDVLRGTMTPGQQEAMRNSLVLVGSTATGLYDLRATPMQAVYPGVEVNASVLDGILRTANAGTVQGSFEEPGAMSNVMQSLVEGREGTFPVRPDWEPGAVRVGLVLLGLLLAFSLPRLGPAVLVAAGLALMLGLITLNFSLWRSYNLDISLVIFLFLVLLLSSINMGYGFLREGLSRRVIKDMFDQYVPPAHIEAMLEDPEQYNFAGESKELSVLFSDIRGFTSISESLSATSLKTLLNDYFTPITGIIFEHQGTVDKYVGDMVMAFWGAPLDDEQHREHAVAAALAMLDKVEGLKQEFRVRGLPEIDVGIGINSGVMNVGDMGSTYRRSYTVLGDAVNLGARLEGLTKFYGVKCLIGEETHDQMSGFLSRLVDRVQVKGKEQAVRIYEPLCWAQEASETLKTQLEQHARACELYAAQDWTAAEAAFKQLQSAEPDSHLYRIYLARIEELRGQELPSDWDGAYRHTSK